VKYFKYIFLLGIILLTCDYFDRKEISKNNSMGKENTEVILSPDSKDVNGWYHDWDRGIIAAKEEKKPVIVDFYTDWCKYCALMDKETFSDPEIKKILISDWIAIKINAEDTKTMGSFQETTMSYRQMSKTFGVKGFPSYLFIDREGNPVNVVLGYYTKEQFSKVIEYYQKEMYKDKVNLHNYIEGKG